MYTRYLEVAAAHGFVALMGGLDYRASPDWACEARDLARAGLAEIQLRSIEFLREVAAPFEGQIPQILSPGSSARAATRTADRTITADEAEEYHAVQIARCARRGVDLVKR